ncbi:MAG TPA: rhomboid family intramembrane serine protease [Ktedonobacterales bacterium]|nr:rhomboid family intramembrane serine protease [Ktedonobacterales bacterium]
MEQQQQASAQSSQIERGDTLLKQGDTREAAEVFAGVVREEPNNPAGHLGLAEASLALGDFATMQQACAQVQQLAPQSSEAAVARALLAALDQRFDIALQEVEHSIELDPTRGYAHALRAYVLRRLGQRYDGALAEARAGRTWGTRDLDHLFAQVPKPAATLPSVAAGADFAPQIPTTPGPRTWDQRSARERQVVRARFAVRGVPVVTYTLMAINVGIFILGIFPGGSALYNFGVAQGNLILSDPVQAYRLLTSMFLHANLLHIATNMLSLFFIGVAVEQLFGRGRYTFIYFASGIIAGLTQMILIPGGAFLGASGAIAGIFGAFGAVILLRRRTLGPAGNALIGQWLFWLAINAFISISNPGIAGWAHLGGLVAGFIIGAIMTTMDGRRRVRAGY